METSFLLQTNFSVIPILNLMPETKYKIKVLAVHAAGYVDGTVDSDWIQTPPVSTYLATPINFRVTRQYVRGASLRALIEWEPPKETGGCFFRLYAMPPQGTYDSMETQFWGELRYELRSLQFSSEYSLEVYNFDENFDMHSKPANLSFRTADCLSAAEFNYNICPPEKPENVSIRSTAMYADDAEHPVSDILVTWDPPRYLRHHNAISNYTLSYWKTPDMHNVRLILPHHGNLVLPGTTTNSTIHGCHWDSVYEIYLTALSPGGRSEQFKQTITLGNGGLTRRQEVGTKVTSGVKQRDITRQEP
ncbi:hypothetical protein C0Q70_09266 [Pomacea canaliculata]|uniref:Fibronectin type-III domain-containing protein n=1 Tax=Pomacea canaliculata TaxID=400727 RepID=A0A2T7P9B0_POMCA|nr:hypothetical protein C0Q70_09266 [Pomacea canaliculata]